MKLEAQRTPITAPAVYEALAAAWNLHFKTPATRSSLLVLVAQWSLETGAGRDCVCFNLGNMKSSGVSGDWCFFETTEVEHGKIVTYRPDSSVCRFKAFSSLTGGAADYILELSSRFKRAWSAVEQGNPTSFAYLLKLQGYYTAKESVYEASLFKLFDMYDNVLGLGVDLFSIAGIQTALARVGFDPGVIDGWMGPETWAAIRHFQAKYGLFVDGSVGGLTRAALGRAWRAATEPTAT